MSLLPLSLVLAAVIAASIGAAVTRRPPPSLETAVAAARRHARLAGSVAVALGVLAALTTAAVRSPFGGGLGVTVLLAPVVFAATHTVVLALGELTWPRPSGQVRRARLVRRGPFDATPTWLLRLTGAFGGVAAVVVTVGALVAGPDGRSVSYTLGDGGAGTVAETTSPFPGWFYGRPAAVGLALLAVVALAALWVVATRPAVATEDERIETALRRASAHRVLRAVAFAVLVDTGGLMFIAGTAVPDLAPARYDVAAVVLVVLGVVSMLAGAVVVCLRAPDVPADRPVAV